MAVNQLVNAGITGNAGLESRLQIADVPAGVVCEGGVCRLPEATPKPVVDELIIGGKPQPVTSKVAELNTTSVISGDNASQTIAFLTAAVQEAAHNRVDITI